MTKTVDFYFTPISPWTYLGMPRLREMAARYEARVNYKPVDMEPLFASAGVKPVKERPEPLKRNRLADLKRWSEFLGMPLNLQPRFFPTSPLLAARMIVAGRRAMPDRDPGAFAEAVLTACWAEERNVSEEATLAAIAKACGYDGRALIEAAGTAEIQAEFEANTKEALSRFVWGSPSYYVEGELFFGQDRLPFLERKLAD